MATAHAPHSIATGGSALHKFVGHYVGIGDRLYGVVDAARDKELAFAARERFGDEARWLFEGEVGGPMSDVAPYLVPIEFRKKYPYDGSEYLDLWAQHLGNNAGILLVTAAKPDVLWSHLREVFTAVDDSGRKYFFRFYDPRVLRTFFPTCNASQAKEFFGPIRRLLVEAKLPKRVAVCRPSPDGVETTEQALEGGNRTGSAGGAPK